jgi:hypothetical protein
MSHRLTVQVTGDLVIDAGSWEETGSGDEVCRVVHPPEQTMFEQLLDWIQRQTPVDGYPGISVQHEALVATALCLRWGSYFAVLADADKPDMGPSSDQDLYGRITDAEMKRINIEASAALEQWLEILYTDYDRYLQLMWVAHRDLPLSHKNVGSGKEDHLMGRTIRSLAHPELAATMTLNRSDDRYTDRVREAQEHPTRVLANALINACWRNGPIESIHASTAPLGYPLSRCRLTKRERQCVLLSVATRLKDAILAITALARYDEDQRDWWQRVLPYHTAHPFFLVTPQGWTLDHKTCEMRLPGPEPT